MTDSPFEPDGPWQPVLEAVRALLAAFAGEQPSDGSGIDVEKLHRFNELLRELRKRPNVAYEGVALAAAVIRWAAHETGRSEEDILDNITVG